MTYYDYRGAKEVKAVPGLGLTQAPQPYGAFALETMDAYGYGLGIRIRSVKNGANLFHTGSIPGTSTLAVRTADGFAWVVMFNGRPQDENGFRGDADRGLWAAKGQLKRWPAGDLFSSTP